MRTYELGTIIFKATRFLNGYLLSDCNRLFNNMKDYEMCVRSPIRTVLAEGSRPFCMT